MVLPVAQHDVDKRGIGDQSLFGLGNDVLGDGFFRGRAICSANANSPALSGALVVLEDVPIRRALSFCEPAAHSRSFRYCSMCASVNLVLLPIMTWPSRRRRHRRATVSGFTPRYSATSDLLQSFGNCVMLIRPPPPSQAD